VTDERRDHDDRRDDDRRDDDRRDDDGELTRDAILRGRLQLWQPKVGYRFAVDPLLLVHFVNQEKRPAVARAVDLGTGCGVAALALALALPSVEVTAVELQPRLLGLARRNADENGLGERVRVVECDLADPRAAGAVLPGASAALVISNPPFRPPGEGGLPPVEEEAIAKHELRLPLASLVREARRVLVPNGRAAFVYPADRLPPLLGALADEGLAPIRLRFVHDRLELEASRVLVEAKKAPKGRLRVEPPFILRHGDLRYTDEARAALGDDVRIE
jgi:tRNA1Val (adenine37-N6)-methyltransferase